MHKADFKVFYETYVDRVFRYIFFRVAQNRQVAEDLTSEIFISALKHYATYDPAKSTSAWIMTITRNRLANHYRDTKHTVDVDELAPLLPGEDGRVSLEEKETQLYVRELMQTLEPKDRQLVELKYLLGYGYKEMAELLGRSAGALKVETHRVMKKLRQHVETTGKQRDQ